MTDQVCSAVKHTEPCVSFSNRQSNPCRKIPFLRLLDKVVQGRKTALVSLLKCAIDSHHFKTKQRPPKLFCHPTTLNSANMHGELCFLSFNFLLKRRFCLKGHYLHISQEVTRRNQSKMLFWMLIYYFTF